MISAFWDIGLWYYKVRQNASKGVSDKKMKNDGFVKELLDKTDLVKLIGEYTELEKKDGGMIKPGGGEAVKKQDNGYWGRCPFCKREGEILQVKEKEKLFHCYVCRQSGNAISIDEAYSLCDGKAGCYGDEAINTIVQEMENNRDSTIVIFAGYKREMEGFIDRNSGLKSRVTHYVDFPDYDENELTAILELMVSEQGLSLSGERTAIVEIMRTATKSENFGNGRFARNLLDKARLKQAGRVSKMDNPQVEALTSLYAADFVLPEEYTKNKSRIMGFS